MMLRVLHQEGKVSCYELVKRYGHRYAERSIYRHAKKPLNEVTFDKRHNNKGRPRKLTLRDERCIVRSLLALRRQRVQFSSRKIQEQAGLGREISNRVIRRCLQRHGYKYRQSRKKGLLTARDLYIRLKYARKHIKHTPPQFWSEDIAFYLDGVGFAHKSNPWQEARAISSMTWRKPSEGLKVTTKGRKEGSGGRMANFFVAISHKHGVVMCKHHTWKVTGDTFAQLIREEFAGVFKKVGSTQGHRRFLQDNCPRQNARVAQRAWKKLGYEMVPIPARSPDLNPIENFFHLLRKKLREDAYNKNIKHESYQVARIKKTMLSFSKDVIQNMIESMPRRLAPANT